MSEPLLLSVVMPTYNRKGSLRLTLEGLARQTLPADQWEVIVVSDGSSDGTNEFLTEYAASAPFSLRPLMQTNAGPSRARNRGIQEAQGRIVVFIDDDVEPAPHFLATHAAHHATDDKIVVIGPLSPDPARRAEEAVWIGWEHAMLEKQYHAFRTGEWPSAGPNHFYSGNASVGRSHLEAVGGFDEAFTRQEDVELAYRLARTCGLHFTVDLNALGTHRPLRTWESWLKVPYAYGQWDVVRARRGDAPWESIRDWYFGRNRVTQRLANLTFAVPGLSVPLRNLLRQSAEAAYRANRDRLAFTALSAVYNLHYLEGARAELGTTSLFRLLKNNIAPETAQSML